MRGVWLLLAILLVSACQHTRPRVRLRSAYLKSLESPQKPTVVTQGATKFDREKMLEFADGLVGQSRVSIDKKTYRADCSGFVRGVYEQAGLSFGGGEGKENDTTTIYRFVMEHGRVSMKDPQPGDLVFFDNTYDKNGDGKMNDQLTHVGIVDKILKNGTVVFIHFYGKTIIRSRMNLDYPHLEYLPGTKERLNHMLRRKDRKSRGLLAAEVFAGFGKLS